jgi:hypothetical protein
VVCLWQMMRNCGCGAAEDSIEALQTFLWGTITAALMPARLDDVRLSMMASVHGAARTRL